MHIDTRDILGNQGLTSNIAHGRWETTCRIVIGELVEDAYSVLSTYAS